MANVLIASLGDHPTVVTAMVKALAEIAGISLDLVHVIYPAVEGERFIEWGYEQIEERLQDRYEVRPCPLPFSDANSYERSIEFLQCLASLLDGHQAAGDVVYLSLAGGRKNMSAMMALATQFYPCAKGLYHLIDRYEDYKTQRSFLRADELLYDPDLESRFFPETERLERVGSSPKQNALS
jgi:hypothetical protein